MPFTFVIIGLFILAIAGLYVSYSMLLAGKGKENLIATSVCGTGAASVCNKISKSEDGIAFLGIGWSELGTIFFGFQILYLFFTKDTAHLSIFDNLLLKLKNAPRLVPINHFSPIVLGNENAEHRLTLITNPYCSACPEVHKLVNDWLQRSDNVSCTFVFHTSTDPANKSYQIVHSFLEAYRLEGKDAAQKALEIWFEKTEFTPKVIDEAKYTTYFKAQENYIPLLPTDYTPAVYYNSFLLPELYTVKDLMEIVELNG